ncbi:MAG: hypothetical protein WBP16_02725 [Ferruginibacter sp.]
MLKKIIGYIFAAIGFIGFVFFKNYKGSTITYSTFWFILSIIIGVLGLYLIYFSKATNISKQEKINRQRLDKLKQNGEKIIITVDNCEIRENNYYEEVLPDNSSRVQQIDALYDPNRNYEQNYIEQSAIIYYYNTSDKKQKMTSQSFPCNASRLINFVEHNRVTLFVNRFNKKDYAFELSI